MTAATMLKRINTMRKDIKGYERELKDIREGRSFWGNDTDKAIAYFSNLIAKKEQQIAEASKKAAALATEEEQEAMVKAMAQDMAERGFADRGYTTNGLKYGIEHNQYGFTDRTAHCFSMWIEGKGVVFTSGTLETVARYILKN